MSVDLAHLTGWETCVWECVILQNRGLVLAGTILILRTQMLPNLHQYSHDRMSQLLLKLLSTASSHLALWLSLKKFKKINKKQPGTVHSRISSLKTFD